MTFLLSTALLAPANFFIVVVVNCDGDGANRSQLMIMSSSTNNTSFGEHVRAIWSTNCR